jgi:hypothetical protein
VFGPACFDLFNVFDDRITFIGHGGVSGALNEGHYGEMYLSVERFLQKN